MQAGIAVGTLLPVLHSTALGHHTVPPHFNWHPAFDSPDAICLSYCVIHYKCCYNRSIEVTSEVVHLEY